MPKQRNKAHHLSEAARMARTVEETRRRQAVQVALAVKAGATWAEVAEATGVKSRQHAHYLWARYHTDGEALWSEPRLPG